jgi:hypothetical protein
MGLGRQDFSGKRLAPPEADAVVADLKKYLADIAERWLIKGRFHTDMAKGTLPMEAIQVFWQNWYGFVAEINNFHGVATSATCLFSSAIPSCKNTLPTMLQTK